MAARTATAPDLASLTERIEQLEQIQAVTLRVLARWWVKSAPGVAAATFRSIMTNELRIATHDECAAIESWLTEHPR